MFAPLSGKQQREWLKFSGKESRESAKMENDEKRKERLHEIKLKEAAAKAEQGLGHKDDLHGIKIDELSGPLGKKPRMNRQKLGLPSSNPMTGTGMFKQGQHMLAQGTDTVPAMLTPGEAVIPRAAAQDPENKPIIAKMVEEGREAQGLQYGTGSVQAYAQGTSKVRDLEMAPNYNEDGSVYSGIPMMNGGYVPYYQDGTVNANYEFDTKDRQGLNPYGLRQQVPTETAQTLDYTIPTPKGNGYMGGMPSADGRMMTEYTMDDNKGQYPSMVPTLGAEDLKTISKGEMTPEINDKARAYRDANVAAGQSPFASSTGLKAPMGYGDFLYKEGQPKPVDISEVSPVPKVATTSMPVPLTVVDSANMPPVPVQPDTSIDTVAEVNNMERNAAKPELEAATSVSRSMAPPPKAPIADRTDPKYWINSFKGANSDVEKAADRYKNDDKGFIESFKDIFSYKGVKDALGLNNQEVARMAVMYLGSRMRGYNSAKSLSFAGKTAFETSLQRQGRESSEVAADRRAEKSDERAIRTAAVQMAGQEKRFETEDKRIDARLEAEDKRIATAERKAELLRVYGENKEARKEVENDMDRLENSLAKNVPTTVRKKAMEMAYAPLKSETPEEQRQERRNNLRNANLFVSSNVLHKDPESGRHDRVAKYGYYEDAKGNRVYAAPDPYGSGKMAVQDASGKTILVNGATLRPEGTTAKQGEMVASITTKYLANMKDKNGKAIDVSDVGVKIMTAMQDFPGLADNPYRANPAIEQTVKILQQDGSKTFSAEAVRKALTAGAVMTLSPTNAQLFIDHKDNKPVSGSSSVEFGDALMKAIDKNGNKVPLEQSSEFYINKWNNMPQEDKVKVLSRPGYSRFQEFVIKETAKQK